jgi:subtilase family protein
MRSVYGFPVDPLAGGGHTVAIVDAYDDPTAESDLHVFDQTFGLPECSTANGCFTKVNQNGGTQLPGADAGWALEISLDVQWAHAVAPGAHLLLVEANSASDADLFTAEDYARTHAPYVSNSWGGLEWSGESLSDARFTQPGVSVFVAAGDSGLPAEYPSSSPNVVSVGGTTLTLDGNQQLVAETGWALGGGGCSKYEIATGAQRSFAQYGQAGCGGRRATPDIALDADPASGASVYDTTPYQSHTGWFTVGGTSLATPMWAARAADAGGALDASTIYGSVLPLRDITAGNNGAPCLVGFDLCSGRGSWTGTGYATDWAASDVPRLLQSATYLATTPDQVQKLGVQLIAYLLALKPPADATPLVPPPDNTGTVSFTTAWTSDEGNALQTVMHQYALPTPASAQKLGAQFVDFLLALGGH